jgi:hypothetical protein
MRGDNMVELDSVQVDRLFKLQTRDEVDQFIQNNCSGFIWHNLGDDESPAANVEVSPDPINPLIERLVNGMESLIQYKLELSLLSGNTHKGMPSSIFEAAERFFGTPQGRARNLIENDRRQLAQNLKIILRGKRKVPTVVVQDKGIGIHPDDMPRTILSLANSSKGKKSYLIGAYGHGGSSSFEWCEYTIVISRKEPLLLGDRDDLIGWTIVKKSAEPHARINDYQYLVDGSEKIPRFDPKLLGIHEFPRGVYVCHVEMRDTEAFGSELAGLAPFRTLDFRLFDPVLPYLLVEGRPEFIGDTHSQGTAGYRGKYDRALAGARGRLEGLFNNPEKKRRVEFWNKGYTISLGNGASVKINYWVLEDLDVDPLTKIRKNDHKSLVKFFKDSGRLSHRPCAVTFGGQVHTSLTEKIFVERNLKRVGESTIIHIETDEMGDYFRGFFGSNRGEPKEQSEKLLEQWLSEAIDIHIDELKKIQRNRFETFLRRSNAQQDIELRKLLDPMIQEFLRGQMVETKESVARRKLPEFKPKQIPTYITFSNPNRIIEIPPGESINVVALTNARDDIPAKAKFELSLSNSNVLKADLTSHHNGRWIIRLSAYPNSTTNSICDIDASLICPGAWMCKTSKSLRVKIEIPPPQPPYLGLDPPTRFRIKNQGGEIKLQEGKQRVIWIDTDCVDDILTRSVKPATFEIASLPSPIIYKGFNQPLRGQIGIVILTPAKTALLTPGYLEVKLKLANGSCFSDKVPIKIIPQPPIGGTINVESDIQLPNYEVVYVSETPTDENVKSWQDMKDQFEQEWNKEDVAGYDISSDTQGNDKLWIFINRDFTDFAAEQRNWSHRGENWIKQMTNLYDTQVAFQCYQASIGRGEPKPTTDSADLSKVYHFIHRDYSVYRAEMVRVGKTILWARKKFGTAITDEGVLAAAQ